jgi:formate hydrogenlyase transcriptional activator
MVEAITILKKQIARLKSKNQQLQKQLERGRILQKQNEEMLRFEMLLVQLSSQFIHLSPVEAESEIEHALELLADFLDVDQIGIFEFLNEDKILKTVYSYSRGDIRSILPEMPSEQYPWWTNQMREGNPVVWQKLPDIPANAEQEKRYAVNDDIKAHLAIPLKVGKTIMGVVGCHSFSKPRTWSNELIQRFRLFGEMMANTITRHRSEIKINQAFNEIKQLKERLEAENFYLREEINLKHRHEEIVGKSRAIKKVLKQIEQVAGTHATVLISGETGTGKELIAQAIHKLSPRNKKALVTLNCAALPPTLVESELFGHEKGAYTGALTKKQGRFEAAHGSTIFLDEINALSLEMQAKLLRILQHGTFERLGSTSTITVDVRILAATNQNLKKEVSAGSFREDLYYRLNVFPIDVPPLRERPEDVPLLVWEFVNEFSKQMGKQIDTIPAKSIEALKGHFWPGNVRELRNLIERSMIITSGKTLKIPPLETPVGYAANDQSLDDVQRRHILNILQKTGWRISGKNGAAQILGINSRTLDSRMQRLGIHRPK